MNKKTLFLILLLGVLVLPSIVSAEAITLQGMAKSASIVAVQVVFFVVIIFWIVTALLFLMAQGDPGKLNTAKMALFTSIAGTVIYIIAKNAVDFVANSFGIS